MLRFYIKVKLMNKLIAIFLAVSTSIAVIFVTVLIVDELRMTNNFLALITIPITGWITLSLVYKRLSGINFEVWLSLQPELCAIAEDEIEKKTYDKGLWSKALMKAKGNEEQRKGEYIKLRARQLSRQS